uniref:MAP kinase-like protein n=1 Tax=Colletotrichum gloeosporioides f. sp. malvae TaxID=96478 RepID=Q8J285_COLGL|nr:MAP kinase-like protein [Colletotrichum gloeosporioides f. sp. malvae]
MPAPFSARPCLAPFPPKQLFGVSQVLLQIRHPGCRGPGRLWTGLIRTHRISPGPATRILMASMSSAIRIHRDLKPGNLLVNADCELKICDFGLARGFSVDPEENAGYMTEYVATRWYRAPEIMLSFQSYTKAIDVWSVGCILAELLGGRPFFKGRDYVDQLNQILHILGTPNEETLSRIGSPRAQEYIRNLPFMPKKPFPQLFAQANPDALDLLDRMLAFDPSSRFSVEQALEHPYLHIWHNASDEPDCPTTFNFDFEVVEDVGDMRKMILEEVYRFRQLVRPSRQHPTGAQAAGQAGAGQVPFLWKPRLDSSDPD